MDHSHRVPFCWRVQDDTSLCTGCLAAAEGLNCWEVDVSPCCQRPRTVCSDCIVYVSYLRAMSTTARVRLCLADGQEVEGDISVRAGQRLSDALNTPGRQFLVLRNAQWVSGAPMGVRDSQEVLFVSVNAILWAVPVSESGGKRSVSANGGN